MTSWSRRSRRRSASRTRAAAGGVQAEGEIAKLQSDLKQKLIDLRGQAPQLGAPGSDRLLE